MHSACEPVKFHLLHNPTAYTVTHCGITPEATHTHTVSGGKKSSLVSGSSGEILMRIRRLTEGQQSL